MPSSPEPSLTLSSCWILSSLPSSCWLCSLPPVHTAFPSQGCRSPQGHHPPSFIPQSSSNTRHTKETTLNFRIDLPALKLLPWVVCSQLPKPCCISPFSHSYNITWEIFSSQIRFNVHLCISRKLIILFAEPKGGQPEWPSAGRIANNMFEMITALYLGEGNIFKDSWLLHQPMGLGFLFFILQKHWLSFTIMSLL